MSLFLIKLHSQNRLLYLLPIDRGLINHPCILIRPDHLITDPQGDGGIVEHQILGHDGEDAIDADELEVFGLF